MFKKGKDNINWNGGTSEYRNHYLMKKNRLIKIKSKCEVCKKKKAVVIHHKDNKKTNHHLDNLQALCRKCHYALHKGRENKTFPFLFIYGKKLKEIAKEKNMNAHYLYRLHSRGINILNYQRKRNTFA